MTRSELVAALMELVGPEGPPLVLGRSYPTSLAEIMKEHEEHLRRTFAGCTWDEFELLIDIVRQPPEDTCEFWNDGVTEALIFVGRRDAERATEQLSASVATLVNREPIIAALGGLGHPSAVDGIATVLDDANATEEELVAAACALGEIGGSAAREKLHQMRRRFTGRHQVLQEVQIAEDSMSQR